MPLEIKNIYKRRKELRNRGYLGFDTELFEDHQLQAARPFDVKEAFDYVPVTSYSKVTPNTDDHVIGFDKMNSQFFKKGVDLTGLLIQLFAISLKLEDKEFFKMQCQSAGDISKNPTNFRTLWYPEIKHEVAENQLRLSEHSDFGVVSLLFQDGTGGLQVLNPEGEYIDMTPIPGTATVNIADMLEVWSGGKLRSTKHRVVLPSNGSVRQSLAFFLHPDYKANVFCLDNSNKHEGFKYKDNYLKVEQDHYGY